MILNKIPVGYVCVYVCFKYKKEIVKINFKKRIKLEKSDKLPCSYSNQDSIILVGRTDLKSKRSGKKKKTEMDPCNYSHVIFVKAIQWKNSFKSR